ncbi:uncharacterized protein LOC124646556 [Lolium rigidum]|uniref:uncharacterized protein LOC124646556 n=1 Tax=Lolium rigidum TaxID=89674 RepID=UPI001F5DF2F0|nr:uncharacterized protein LOC124646556 [Lolium rigidum]
MDRSWIRKGVRRLSTEHTKGVEEFMQFVHRSFGEDAQVLCPCRSCLNREEQTLANVEAHLLMYGMASTYDRWIHHGEPLHAPQPEQDQPDGEAHHVDHEGDDFVEDDQHMDDGLEEEDGNEDDRIPDLFRDLYKSEPQGGDGDKTIFAELIEEAKRAASDGGTFSRFTFTVKLLHVKSYYRISNAAFNAILRILTLQYPKSSIPRN